jgi:hypothetical protein
VRAWADELRGEEEVVMALARVVSFDGVSQARVEEMKAQMAEGRPDDIPATEVVMLYDADAESRR